MAAGKQLKEKGVDPSVLYDTELHPSSSAKAEFAGQAEDTLSST